MCGRYTLSATPDDIVADFSDALTLEPNFHWEPRFNIAPSQAGLVARHGNGDALEVTSLRWGLIPHWAKDKKIGNKLINARAETVAEKPSFRTAYRRRRCLVLADGYYEWSTRQGPKQAHHIRPKEHKILCFGGLWESWNDPNGDCLQTYTIITTSANEQIEPIHNRMPLCITREHATAWINPESNRETLDTLLRTPADGTFVDTIVSNYVNSPRNEGPDCIKPIEG